MTTATRPRHPSNTEHPAALGSFRSWMQLLVRSRGIDAKFLPRALFVALTTLATSPFRLWEKIVHSRRIRRTTIHPSPIVIVGHWRSGTTHLQNLLCQDAQFGYLSTFQAMAPGFFLTGDRAIKGLVARVARSRYPTRLIDNIPLAFDAPQEDEFALANLSPRSFVHAFSFPRKAREIFERNVLLRGPSAAPARWLKRYRALLRKTTLACNGKRLIIKNCAHSARIPSLLAAFPDAKFIHIHRNPYDVYLSTLHMHHTVLARSQLQRVDSHQMEKNVLFFYEELLQRYFGDRTRVPVGNLMEIRFEDLEAAPLAELRRIYEAFDLPAFGAAEPKFRTYIDSVSGYRKNVYQRDKSVIERVNAHWGFAFDALGYDRIDPA